MTIECGSVTLEGIARDCYTSMGGIKEIWLAPYKKGVAELDKDNKFIENIPTDTLESFKKYNTKKNVSSLTSTFNIDATNGTNYVSTELSLTFARMTTDKRMEISTLVTGELMAIVQDANGIYWFLGKDEAVTATAGTAQTGAAKGDGNNYQLTLTDESEVLPYEVSSALAAQLKED